jgi:hypothetical protein
LGWANTIKEGTGKLSGKKTPIKEQDSKVIRALNRTLKALDESGELFDPPTEVDEAEAIEVVKKAVDYQPAPIKYRINDDYPYNDA